MTQKTPALVAIICIVGCLALAGYNVSSMVQTGSLDTKTLALRMEPLWTISTPATALSWSPDSRYIATVGSNGLSSSPIIVWDITANKPLLQIENEKPISSLAWSPDGSILAVASDSRDNNPILELYDAHTGLKTNTFTGFASEVGRPTNLQWSPDGTTLAITVAADQLRLLDARTGKERYSYNGRPRRFINGIAWSPDSRTFASTDASTDMTALGLYDSTTGDLIHDIPSAQSDYEGTLAWSPDGSTLAVVLFKIRLYDPTTLGQRLTIEGDVSEASWSSDSRILASRDRGHGNGFIPEGADVIRLWDAATGKELRNLSADTGVKGHVIWSPVGYRMAIPGRNLVIWGIR